MESSQCLSCNVNKYCRSHSRMVSPPILFFFFLLNPWPHQNRCPLPWTAPNLKVKLSPNWRITTLHWKMTPHSRKWFLENKSEKLEHGINTCVSHIKQRWKKMAEIWQKHFLTCCIQDFGRKVKLWTLI